MWIAGILLMAVGIALGLMVFFSTTSMVSWGITPEVAAILIVGGILALGQGAIIHAVETARPAAVAASTAATVPPPAAAIPEFGRRVFDTTPPATAAAAAEAISPAVKETIRALEQAKQEIRQAFEEKPAEAEAEATPEPAAAPETPPVVVENTPEEPAAVEEVVEAEEAAAAEEEEVAEDGQLYVVEERVIRNRPARVLSDGTVEAETDEGWMRFENLEHLDEYLEAMAPTPRA